MTPFFRKPWITARGLRGSSLLHTMIFGFIPTSPVAKMLPIGCRAIEMMSSVWPVTASVVGSSTRKRWVLDSEL